MIHTVIIINCVKWNKRMDNSNIKSVAVLWNIWYNQNNILPKTMWLDFHDRSWFSTSRQSFNHCRFIQGFLWLFKQEENTRISPRAGAEELRAPLSIILFPTLQRMEQHSRWIEAAASECTLSNHSERNVR